MQFKLFSYLKFSTMVMASYYELLFYVATLVTILFVYFTWNNDYWKKRGVVFIKPTPFFGSMFARISMRKSIFEIDRGLYEQLDGHKFGGYFEATKPMLLVRDPDLIRAVLVKDFDHFVDRRLFSIEEPIISKMMTVVQSQEWKDIRSAVSPTFTSGKLKIMIELVNDCGEQLAEYLRKTAQTGESVEVKSIFGRYTMDVISTTAFGLQINTLENPDSDFVKHAHTLQNPGVFRMIMLLLIMFTNSKISPLLKALNLEFFDSKALDFFTDVVKTTIEHREKHGVHRPDFLQLMLDARRGNLAKEDEKLDTFEKDALLHSTPVNSKTAITDNVIIAQSILFFLAGYDTTSTLLMFMAYELALEPEIQERLRDEIMGVLKKHNNKCTYDGIQEMPYLDMCLQETLRKNPPASRLERSCTEEYTLPGTDIKLKKGDMVVVSAAGLHYDEKYFPDPHRFDPERFSSENKSQRSPYAFLPFGQGPRNCIGMRFALMEAKVALVHVLSKFRIKVSEKTQIPYKPCPKTMILHSKDGMWLAFEAIQE